MKKDFTVSEKIAYPLETVWSVIQKPADLHIHGSVRCDRISDTEWIEHTSDQIENRCTATVKPEDYSVEIQSANSKFPEESDDIIITLTSEGEAETVVTIQYSITTTAIFNMVSFKLFGDKIMHFSSNTIFKNIEKKCR